MAHNGGNCPLPSHRLGPPIQTARLLPRNANILLPHTSSTTSTATSSTRHHHNNDFVISNLESSSSSRNIITLDQPRPGVARVRNEYIETPLRTQLPTLAHIPPSTKGSNGLIKRQSTSPDDVRSSSSGLAEVHHGNSSSSSYYHLPYNQRPINHLLLQPSSPHQDGRLQILQSPKASLRFNQHHPTDLSHHSVSSGGGNSGSIKANGNNKSLVISQQPSSSTLNKLKNSTKSEFRSVGSDEGVEEGDEDDGGSECGDVHRESIICPKCGRCRCDACRGTRPLPSTWICSDSYQCSFETTLDQCTCMCCVKAIFYHCCKDYELDDDVSCADKPCSCSPHHRWMRWGSLCLLTAILPCLLCYWPMRVCLKLCEACHTRLRHQGCRCPPNSNPNHNSKSTKTLHQQSTINNQSGDNGGVKASFTRKNHLDTNTKPQQHQHAKRLLDPTV
ncbi:hypothetical protein CHUAL_007912 [Chamberlinius hualienensis]